LQWFVHQAFVRDVGGPDRASRLNLPDETAHAPSR
jgi:hypothetical protein